MSVSASCMSFFQIARGRKWLVDERVSGKAGKRFSGQSSARSTETLAKPLIFHHVAPNTFPFRDSCHVGGGQENNLKIS
jgi:hypothetical protein